MPVYSVVFASFVCRLGLESLLRSRERKHNFDLSSLPFAISVPVHDDTGKFQHSREDTKMASPQLIFQGH